jgi:hypothetical protein
MAVLLFKEKEEEEGGSIDGRFGEFETRAMVVLFMIFWTKKATHMLNSAWTLYMRKGRGGGRHSLQSIVL